MQTKVHVTYCGFDKIFMDKDLIEDKLQMTDQFNERKSTPKIFVQYNKKHLLHDGNGTWEHVRFCLLIMIK